MTGRFISLEGGEGTGKSTQAGLLVERLRERGIDVVLTREPGGTPGAEAIRALLLAGEPERWSATVEALLLNAARADHVERLIRPALADGKWVVSDRFVDSTFAYQGAAGGMRPDDLRMLHEIAAGGLWPDRTILLDAPLAESMGRARAATGDRFERRGEAFHDKVRQGFWGLAEAATARYRIVETTGSIKETAERVWAEVAMLLSLP